VDEEILHMEDFLRREFKVCTNSPFFLPNSEECRFESSAVIFWRMGIEKPLPEIGCFGQKPPFLVLIPVFRPFERPLLIKLS